MDRNHCSWCQMMSSCAISSDQSCMGSGSSGTVWHCELHQTHQRPPGTLPHIRMLSGTSLPKGILCFSNKFIKLSIQVEFSLCTWFCHSWVWENSKIIPAHIFTKVNLVSVHSKPHGSELSSPDSKHQLHSFSFLFHLWRPTL